MFTVSVYIDGFFSGIGSHFLKIYFFNNLFQTDLNKSKKYEIFLMQIYYDVSTNNGYIIILFIVLYVTYAIRALLFLPFNYANLQINPNEINEFQCQPNQTLCLYTKKDIAFFDSKTMGYANMLNTLIIEDLSSSGKILRK